MRFEISTDLLFCVSQQELETYKGALFFIEQTEEHGYMHPVSEETGKDIPWRKVPEDILIEYAQKVWSDMANQFLNELDFDTSNPQ